MNSDDIYNATSIDQKAILCRWSAYALAEDRVICPTRKSRTVGLSLIMKISGQ